MSLNFHILSQNSYFIAYLNSSICPYLQTRDKVRVSSHEIKVSGPVSYIIIIVAQIYCKNESFFNITNSIAHI